MNARYMLKILQSRKKREKTPIVQKERDTEAFLIRKEGMMYSDLLKEVREKVKPGSETARSIRTIREARNGQMLLVVDKRFGRKGGA